MSAQDLCWILIGQLVGHLIVDLELAPEEVRKGLIDLTVRCESLRAQPELLRQVTADVVATGERIVSGTSPPDEP